MDIDSVLRDIVSLYRKYTNRYYRLGMQPPRLPKRFTTGNRTVRIEEHKKYWFGWGIMHTTMDIPTIYPFGRPCENTVGEWPSNSTFSVPEPVRKELMEFYEDFSRWAKERIRVAEEIEHRRQVIDPKYTKLISLIQRELDDAIRYETYSLF